jgi:glycosyltransferase involved in cell wall biosynthesis
LTARLEIQNKVEFAGHQDNPHAYLARADLFVLSSNSEGFGNVIVEAMACECPVISTDCPSGPGEIMTHGTNGLLTPVNDVEKLSDGMLLLLKDNNLRKKLIKNALLHVKDFKLEMITQKYYDQLTDISDQSK